MRWQKNNICAVFEHPKCLHTNYGNSFYPAVCIHAGNLIFAKLFYQGVCNMPCFNRLTVYQFIANSKMAADSELLYRTSLLFTISIILLPFALYRFVVLCTAFAQAQIFLKCVKSCSASSSGLPHPRMVRFAALPI